MAIAPNTTFVSGAILTAAQQNAFGFSTVGLTTSTSLSQVGVTSIVDLTGMSVTFTAIANRNYKISAYMYAIPTVTNACATLSIREGSTTHQQIITNLGVANIGATMTGYVIKTFTAGSITLKLSGALTSGSTGTIGFNGASNLPVSILVEDIGPA
jgi:hypothetical protein